MQEVSGDETSHCVTAYHAYELAFWTMNFCASSVSFPQFWAPLAAGLVHVLQEIPLLSPSQLLLTPLSSLARTEEVVAGEVLP